MHLSAADNAQYRSLCLDNQLRILLVSDEQAEKSACAVTINAGHFDDPVDLQGLGHLLEHMLFLGTEGFPNANEFNQFLSTHGGHVNAWTATEHSSFFFDVNHDGLETGLSIFSEFFHCPLFDSHRLEQEKKAIDSEFKLKVKDDLRRLYQVHKETCNPAHPFSKFSVGNEETLGKIDNDDLRQRLVDHYKTHYLGNRMCVVIVSSKPLDELETLGRKLFAPVASCSKVKEEITEPLYLKENLGIQISIVPLKDAKRLILSFALPGIDPYFRTKPVSFLSHLLGHEGKGSLLSYLKNKGWVNTLSAGGGVNGSNFKDFNINVQLTERGVQRTSDIISSVFSFIELIKFQGIEQWIFEEKGKLAQLAFALKEKEKPLDYASHLSVSMHHYPEDYWIYGDYVFDTFDRDCISNILEFLVPNNMRVKTIWPDQKTDMVSKYYNTPYSFTKINETELEHWKNPHVIDDLRLPEANPFISARTEAQPLENEALTPQCILDTEQMKIWHLQDCRFRKPKGDVFVSFDNPSVATQLKGVALKKLFVEVFHDYVNELNYPAEVTGLHYHVYAHQGGVTLHTTGYSEKQPELLARLLSELQDTQFSSQRITTIKNQLIITLDNQTHNKPVSQLFAKLAQLLHDNSFSSQDISEAMDHISAEEVINFAKSFFNQCKVDIFVHGDWTRAQANGLGQLVHDSLLKDSESTGPTPRLIAKLDSKSSRFFGKHIANSDVAVVTYVQAGSNSWAESAKVMFIEQLIAPEFFNELRTEQQLGYVVGTGFAPMNKTPGMVFYVQSPTHGPEAIYESIFAYLTTVPDRLSKLSDEAFSMAQRSMCQQLLDNDTNLRLVSNRFWTCLANDDVDFNMHHIQAETILRVTQDELIAYAKTLFSKNFRYLTLYSYAEDSQQLSKSNYPHIESIAEFKDNARYFN